MSAEHVSRREFMGTGLSAGPAVALALLGGPRLQAKERPPVGEKGAPAAPYKLGILGCGNRSKAHLAALNGVPQIEVAALCDVVPHKMEERAKLIRKGPAPRRYADMEKMVRQEDLDAIAVVLPNHLHKRAALTALQAGKHVFCEKPMALTVADCDEMIAAAERAHRALQIGTQRRHSPGQKAAVAAIRQASVGNILSSDVNSYRGDWRVPAADEYPPDVPYWRLNQDQCGGVVYEMGAHAIDLNNWIFDSEPMTVVSLQGVNDPALRPRDSTDHAGVLVRYANGALMNYGGNLYARGPAAANYFYAVRGTIRLSDEALEITYGHPSGFPAKEPRPKPVQMALSGEDGTQEQWRHFALVLAGRADPYPDGRAGRQSIQICQGAVVSARDRTVVNVKELA